MGTHIKINWYEEAVTQAGQSTAKMNGRPCHFDSWRVHQMVLYDAMSENNLTILSEHHSWSASGPVN